MDYADNLRQNMRRILEICGITQVELAERSSVSAGFMTDLLAGEANPTLKTLQDMSDGLQIPLPILLKPGDAEEWQAILAVLAAPKQKQLPHIPKGWGYLDEVVLQADRIAKIREWMQAPRRGRPRKDEDA